ncbi:nucleolar RNA-binding Nop10p family protein [Candidatus Micrarchaeota archaeon]|nr:nucleolar RNA-binding Nop10p family protein [Candidatus Micrarchaeota archaeon]
MKRLRKCPRDGYTLKEECAECGEPTKSVHPAPYSPHDKYAQYRRKEKYGK